MNTSWFDNNPLFERIQSLSLRICGDIRSKMLKSLDSWLPHSTTHIYMWRVKRLKVQRVSILQSIGQETCSQVLQPEAGFSTQLSAATTYFVNYSQADWWTWCPYSSVAMLCDTGWRDTFRSKLTQLWVYLVPCERRCVNIINLTFSSNFSTSWSPRVFLCACLCITT
jgi:hypothetical protein